MKITILGCGTSAGVPVIGNDWGLCDPNEPRNRRTRVSVLVEQGPTTLLIDTSPDMREQLLRCDLKDLTAVLYTHAHADHTHGIDDLRSVNWMTQKPVDVYADSATLDDLKIRFLYIFKSVTGNEFYKPQIVPHVIDGPFVVGEVAVTPFTQDHGHGVSLGFRMGGFAYSTDVHRLDDAAFAALEGIDTWVVDCVREKPHPTHSHLEQTLGWIERVKPRRAFLTHMNNAMDYATLCAKLPPHIRPSYDGLVFEC